MAMGFNTSHVTLYPIARYRPGLFACCFNTSHVTLYQVLSWIFLRKKISFNTSHVTLYLHGYRKPQKQEQRFNTSHVTLYPLPLNDSLCSLPRFNTSHVTLYLSRQSGKIMVNGCFNTSHVTLYLVLVKFFQSPKQVSIHLMLLFIKLNIVECRFQSVVSIHLMLLFIMEIKNGQTIPTGFQYISCYSLSILLIALWPIRLCFNTSHVTLYLSYSPGDICNTVRFNTSHVTLYQKEKMNKLIDKISFNTSHVTLYPAAGSRPAKRFLVSIHLMLLFISTPPPFTICITVVSIHLMLLFISQRFLFLLQLPRFNTSHVTLYRENP